MPEHVIGITKGFPLKTHRIDPKTGLEKHQAQYHGTCDCGWQGEDGSAETAQSDALSHQAGKPVRRTRLTVVASHAQADDDSSPKTGHKAYRLTR